MKVLLAADRTPMGFVYMDRKIIQSAFDVHAIHFTWSKNILLETISQARKADVVYAWFAGHHTYLASIAAHLLRKRLIVASSDYDLANEPSFNYGAMRGGVRARINNHIFCLADAVVVPSEFSYQLAIKNTILGQMRQKLYIVPHGFQDIAPESTRKNKCMSTVGELSPENWIRKGLREFVKLASRFNDLEAYLAGKATNPDLVKEINATSGARVKVTGFLPDNELSNLLGRSKVYAQLSYMEGFGCSLAEAMIARCVPVVTRQGALPEVVGECGYYSEYGNIEDAASAVRAALEDPSMGERARERILDCFPLSRRSGALLQLFNC